MEQHIFDDGVRSLPMLAHLVEIALECSHKLVDFRSLLFDLGLIDDLPKLIDELDGNRREIVDEV